MVKHPRTSNGGCWYTCRPSEAQEGYSATETWKELESRLSQRNTTSTKTTVWKEGRGVTNTATPTTFFTFPFHFYPPTHQNQWESKEQGSTNNGVFEVSLWEHRDEQRLDLEEQRRTRLGREIFCYSKDSCCIDGHLVSLAWFTFV